MGKQAGRGALEEVGEGKEGQQGKDSAGVSPPEKAGSMEAAALSMVVKGESTCMGHAQAAGRGQAGGGTVPQERSRRKAGRNGLHVPCKRGFHFQEGSAQSSSEHSLGHHLNVRNWELGKADARFQDLWP